MSVILEINPEYSNEHLQALARAEIAEFHKPKTFDERQAKMTAMLARMREPEYQTDVDVADAVIERVAEAHRKNIKWENADDQGRPEAMIIKERRVAETRQEKAEADDERSRLRGDSLDDAQAPTTTPATPAAVELDADAPVPMADAPAKTPAPLPEALPRHALYKKPEQRRADILAAISKMGFNPMALPPPMPGKQGVKNQIFVSLYKPCGFENDWQKLVSEVKIRYANEVS